MQDILGQYAEELAWRFVKGTVLNVQDDIAHFAVSIPNRPDIKRARLTIDPQHIEAYSEGANHPLFIDYPTHVDRELFHATDGPMADPGRNPWLLGQIRNGDVIEGTVVGYVENYAVIVDLCENLSQNLRWQGLKRFSGFLHIAETPDGRINNKANIRQSLHIGDTVQALVEEINAIELRIRLDVNAVLDLRQREASQTKTPGDKPPRLLPEVTAERAPRPEKTLLLVDDDTGFCREQQTLLRHWNIKVRFCQDLAGLQRELKQQSFDACLMDCDLGLKAQEQAAMGQLLESGSNKLDSPIRFAYLTGNETLRAHHPEQTLSKPLRIDALLAWLDRGEIAQDTRERRLLFTDKGRRWQVKGSEAFVIERARVLLAHCCEKIAAHSALWIREERTGYFVVRVSHNIQGDQCRDLEKELQNSRIATAIESNVEQQVEADKSGPLHKILGGFGYVWVMPFGPSEKPDRALVLFSVRRLNDEQKDYIRDQKDHLIDITHLMDATLALESSEVFASAGLLLSSTLHEIRTAASNVAGRTQHLTDLLNRPLLRPSEDELREDMESMVLAARRLLELCEDGLDRVRPEHNRIPDLLALLQETRHQMLGRLKTLNTPATLAPLRCELDKKDEKDENKPMPIISLPYPPKFVEIPLINLLDNALLHCGARPWAKVEISLGLDINHPQTPLMIRVEDNGLGMTSGQRSQLFNPRKTSRGLAGSGIGLYLSKQLIESIGGTIALEKTVRWLGTRFVIRLPQVG